MKSKTKAMSKPAKGSVGNPANKVSGPPGGTGPKTLNGKMNERMY